jgi:hypothetical protein
MPTTIDNVHQLVRSRLADLDTEVKSLKRAD